MLSSEREYNQLTEIIIKCCIEVHRELGPGLMKSVYENCVSELMMENGLFVQRKLIIPVVFRGKVLNQDFIIDALVNEEVVLEYKIVEAILPVHESQLLTYLKLSKRKIGLLINFNVPLLKDGIRRKTNGSLNPI